MGDIAVRADVTVNKKGGSLTATLKKSLRDRLGETGARLSAAAVEFGTGQTVLLLSRSLGERDVPVHVRKVGENRFEIEALGDTGVEIDEVTAAFLRLKRDLFTKGKLEISGPLSADDWRATMDAKLRAVESAVDGKD